MWQQARNNGVEYSKKLRLEAIGVISNILGNQPGLKKRIKTATGGTDITEKIAAGLGEAIWRSILTGKPEPVHIWVNKGRVQLRFFEYDSDMKLDLDDSGLAKELLSVCRQVVTKLREGTKSDLVRSLADEVRRMQDTTEELQKKLDRLILKPAILRTRCELCPA